MRFETLKRYGYNEQLAGRYPDKAAREQAIRQLAADWARNWDANSLVILRRATIGFDTVKDFAKIRAKVLYVLCRSDALFPPSLMPGVMQDLATAGVEARYFEIDSDLGHSASGPEHAKWSPVLRELPRPVDRQTQLTPLNPRPPGHALGLLARCPGTENSHRSRISWLVGSPAVFHSGKPSSSRRARCPRPRSNATASNERTHHGPRQ